VFLFVFSIACSIWELFIEIFWRDYIHQLLPRLVTVYTVSEISCLNQINPLVSTHPDWWPRRSWPSSNMKVMVLLLEEALEGTSFFFLVFFFFNINLKSCMASCSWFIPVLVCWFLDAFLGSLCFGKLIFRSEQKFLDPFLMLDDFSG